MKILLLEDDGSLGPWLKENLNKMIGLKFNNY